MNTKKMLTLGAAVTLSLSLGACSSIFEDVQQLVTPAKISSTSSGKQPMWVENLKKYQKDNPDKVFFVGMYTEYFLDTSGQVSDYSTAREKAYADAMGNFVNGIKDTVHNLYTAAKTQDINKEKYNSNVEKIVEDGVSQKAKEIIAKADVGINKHVWWNQYVKTKGSRNIHEKYSIYTLVSMPKEKYRKLVELTLSDEQKDIKDVQAKTVIKEMKSLYLK